MERKHPVLDFEQMVPNNLPKCFCLITKEAKLPAEAFCSITSFAQINNKCMCAYRNMCNVSKMYK